MPRRGPGGSRLLSDGPVRSRAGAVVMTEAVDRAMRFSLNVLGGPADQASARSALQFARAVLDGGHEIHRVFFQGAGVHLASALTVVPQDEDDPAEAWAALGREHDLDLVVCVASALRRGLLDDAEAARYERGRGNLRPEFTISGLGQLADAALRSDRVVTFAP